MIRQNEVKLDKAFSKLTTGNSKNTYLWNTLDLDLTTGAWILESWALENVCMAN